MADDIPPQDLTHTGSAHEHQSSGLSQLMGDLTIENVPPDSEASTYLRKLFSARVSILKRVPKGARVNLACLYSEVIIDISKHPDEVSNWLKLMSIPAHCLKATDRGGKKHRTNLTSSVNSAIRSFSGTADIPEQPKKWAKSKKETESLRKRVQEKINDSKILGAIGIASPNYTMPEITPETVNEMEEKHPRHKFAYAVQGNKEQECITTVGSTVHSCINSFPNGSAGELDKLRPQIIKEMVGMCNEISNKLIEDLTGLTTIILSGGVPIEIRPFYFGANLFALKKPSSGVRPIAVGNTRRRLAAKYAGKDHELLEQRKCSYGSTQLGFGTKNGCEAAVHAIRKFLSSPGISDEHVLVKTFFENASNSISRQHMVENISEKYPRLKSLAFSAYSQPSYLFFGSHILNSDEGAQQGDPEGPPMFCDTINDMIHSLTSALNSWYLDDGNIADKFRVVFEDLKLVIERAPLLGLKVKPSKCELTFPGSPSEELRLEILQLLNTFCPAIQETPLDDLCILGASMGADCVLDKLTERSKDLDLLSERLVEIEALGAFSFEKLVPYTETDISTPHVTVLHAPRHTLQL